MKPMLAHTFTDQNPAGWLMSEKLDGGAPRFPVFVAERNYE